MGPLEFRYSDPDYCDALRALRPRHPWPCRFRAITPWMTSGRLPFSSAISCAVGDFHGARVPVWGLNEKIGVKATFVNGLLQWYRSQVDGAPDGSPLPDTGIYGIKPDENGGWRGEKSLIFPPEMQLVPMPAR